MSRPKGRDAFKAVRGRAQNMYGLRARRLDADTTVAEVVHVVTTLRKSKGSQAVLRQRRELRRVVAT